MPVDRRVKNLLASIGAVLKRSKKHQVYGLPDGRNIVMAGTPSDKNAVPAQIAQIKKTAGIVAPVKTSTRVHRDKPGRYGERDWSTPQPFKLGNVSDAGITANALKEAVDQIESLKRKLEKQTARGDELYARVLACRWCQAKFRLKRWWAALQPSEAKP